MSASHGGHKKLGWFLCWAIVFADIGTSLYYVPGILFGEVRDLSGLFVLMSSIVFVLLVLKYIEITDRYPEGGGVVTVATHAFGPWFGALGGMFITVDYFLTASISSISGFAYLNSVINIGSIVGLLAIVGLILLGILNIIGIKESAKVTALVATAAFIVDIVLVLLIATQVGPEGWSTVLGSLTKVSTLGVWPILTGFAGSFLAFSGLESISQLSPAMALPRKKVAAIAMGAVVVAIMLTSPLLTLFSTNLLTAKAEGTNETILEEVAKVEERTNQLQTTNDPTVKTELQEKILQGKEYSERFISELGAQYGGTAIKIAVVLTASILLLFASNTAIIGAYHVFIALARQNFLPQIFLTHNNKFGTPHYAVLLAVVAPIIIIIATKGDVGLLGELYAFGLLGAFGLSSLGLDIVRWKENRKINLSFIVGIITTILVVIAWLTNLYNKQLATVFGGGITITGMIIAYIVYKNSKPHKEVSHKKEVKVEDKVEMHKHQIFVPVFNEFDHNLFEFVAMQAKSSNKTVLITYIRAYTDILQTVSKDLESDKEAVDYLKKAEKILDKFNIDYRVKYVTSTDIGETINRTRTKIAPSVTIISPHHYSKIVEFLKGDVLEKVITHKNGNILIYTGGGK